MTQSHMPQKYWVEAFQTAVYLINMLPTRVLQQNSPYKVLFNRSPSYEFLLVFGCTCFPFLRPYNQNKLQPQSCSCVFLGYSLNNLGYQCLYLTTGKVFCPSMCCLMKVSSPLPILDSHLSVSGKVSSLTQVHILVFPLIFLLLILVLLTLSPLPHLMLLFPAQTHK